MQHSTWQTLAIFGRTLDSVGVLFDVFKSRRGPLHVRIPVKLLGHCDVTDVFILHGISKDDVTEESHINKRE